MKKVLPVLIITICLVAGIIYIHSVNKKSKEPDITVTPPPASAPTPTFAAGVPVGEPITFEVTYRGITGKKDDLRPYSFSGYGEARNYESSFIDAVKKTTDNDIYVARHHYLKTCGMEFSAVEYKDRKVLAAYFDLNGDGALSKDERVKPIAGWNGNRSNEFNFVTPDFIWENKEGVKMPFRVLLQASFYGNPEDMNTKPQVMWSPMGLYEGTVTLNGEKLRCYLFPSFYSQGYKTFGQSNFSLVSASRERKNYVPRRNLSSLIVHNKTFYRVCVQACEADSHKLFVSLAEDKSERGKVALKIEGGDDFKHRLNNANLQGAEDKTIHFSISGGMDELPVGKYAVNYGYLNYGKEKAEGFSTSFQKIPAFAIQAGKTTTIELGKPAVKLQAIEQNKRYSGNKKYKTEFPEGTAVYIDAVFTGKAGETYRGFDQLVQKENYSTHEDIKGRIKIVDADNQEVVNKELEYG